MQPAKEPNGKEEHFEKYQHTDIKRNDIADSLQNYNGADKNAARMSINNGNV